jgi:hypothetical protein
MTALNGDPADSDEASPHLRELVSKTSELLVEASNQFERRMKESGSDDSHDWAFAIRETLLDLRRMNLMLVDIYSLEDPDRTIELLGRFVQMILYEMLPHIQGHMAELEEELSRFHERKKGSNPA